MGLTLVGTDRAGVRRGLNSRLLSTSAIDVWRQLGFTFLIDGRYTLGGDPVDLIGGTTVTKGDGATESTYPTHNGADGWTFDGGDYFVTAVTPAFTATTGQYCMTAVFSNAEGNDAADRVVSGESDNLDGLSLQLWTSDAEFRGRVGGSSTSVSVARTGFAVDTLALLSGIVDAGVLRVFKSTAGMSNDSSITGIGTVTSAPVVIGGRADSPTTSIWAGSIKAVGLGPVAPTAAQLTTLATLYSL